MKKTTTVQLIPPDSNRKTEYFGSGEAIRYLNEMMPKIAFDSQMQLAFDEMMHNGVAYFKVGPDFKLQFVPFNEVMKSIKEEI